MKKRGLTLLLLVTLLIAVTFSSVPAALSQGASPQLRMVVIEVDSAGQVKELARLGLDIAAVREGPEKVGARGVSAPSYRVEAVVSALDVEKIERSGFKYSEMQRPEAAALHPQSGDPQFNVYHSFDEEQTGIKDQLYSIARQNRRVAKLVTIGRSLQGRPILAMRLTNDRDRRHDDDDDDDKAEVLYVATTHAREWISTEVAMRLIKYLTSNYGASDRVTDLLNTTEVWIIPVVNPDGYQYTFTDERLWRKNLRDNDEDGQITVADGVDLNRNFDGHWGQDDEGSSPNFPDGTFRGEKPNSEPETRALTRFIKRHDFDFTISYHSYGNLILYPWGWQVKTPSYDDPIFVAQAGTDDNPAIIDSYNGVGYDPGVGADLYITNGEYTDWAYDKAGVPGYTVELTPGEDTVNGSYGFEFPDDEGLVQTVFEDNLEFALTVAESAKDPAHPVSSVDIETEDLYHTPLTDSYGEDQIVEVLARKKLKLELKYSINGGKSHEANFKEKEGEIYNTDSGLYYSKYQAVIKDQSAGDTVEYRINTDETEIGAYSYSVTSATGNPILLLAAEDYTGANPDYPNNTEPNYLHYYTDALDAGGYDYDVWNVDVQGVPSYAEVLSHYKAVIWYTGDDFAATVPLGLDTQEIEVLNIRDFINYDEGKVFATGQDLSYLAAVAAYYSDDFYQYYMGAKNHVEGGGMDPASGLPFDIAGVPGDPIFDGLSFSLNNSNGGDGAGNQFYADTFLPTSNFLPNFKDDIAAKYSRPGGPFEPHTGDYYVYSQQADLAYKRLGGTFAIPLDAPTLKFWTSYDIEADWDFAFVEVSEVGSGVWTTLPDVSPNALTTTSTGLSCPEGWIEQIHPFLANYQTVVIVDDVTTCEPTGTTGSWNAFSGNSGGWKQAEIDLTPYAGQTVELYISYASDWGFQGLGMFVDDIELAGSPVESFESSLGQWAVSVAPDSTAFNNWDRITAAGFPEGPALRTANTVYFGFGFEAIDTADNRNAVMDRVMEYLLDD